MQIDIPRFMIAAPASGSGKTTIATGLMAALAATEAVQGFKVGPDYIDPMYHTAATGRPARNLDTWMAPPEAVLATCARAVRGAEIAVIEGVMGLFDGFDGESETGSSAEVAKLLAAPVILVLDVSKMARSAAAIALGCRTFDPALNIAGVICNRVASPAHAEMVTAALAAIGLPVLGCIPKAPELAVPERHLGLHTAVERQAEVAAFLKTAAALMAARVDLTQLRQIACTAPAVAASADAAGVEPVHAEIAAAKTPARIAVARDEAFCFYYEDNLDLLRAAGAEIVPFSPLRDPGLPAGVNGIYLGGGYPELYAAQLAANRGIRQAIRIAHGIGIPIYAECGGLMYLTEGISGGAGEYYPMVGLLPGYSRLTGQLTMGYRLVTAERDSLLLRRGEEVRGHEFHYSEWTGQPAGLPSAYRVAPRHGSAVRSEGYAQGNLLASYVHLHFSARPELARRFVQACRLWQTIPDSS
ncbi:MAG: cobyrinate a,c-diamide synthase [Anaerolineae bacterium]